MVPFTTKINISSLAVALAICWSTNFASAQQPFDFFWSTDLPGSGLVVNQHLDVGLVLGETQMLHLYYTTDGPSQSELRFGGGLEIFTSQTGTIRFDACLLYTSPSPRDAMLSRMPSSA